MSFALSPSHQRAITLLSVAAFASAASNRLCDPMLPALSHDFGRSPADAAQVVSAFAVAYGLLQAFFGPLGDRLGKYRLIALTTLASTLGTTLATVASSLNGLILARLLAGATAAGIIPLAMAWIGDTVPYEHRQATLARFLGGQVLGIVGGQFIGGVFADTLGWRWAFGFLAVLYGAIGLMVWRESRRNPVTQPPARDAVPHTGLLAQVSAVCSVPWARTILLIVFIEGVLVFGALAFVPSYIHHRFGLTLTLAGALMAFFGVGGLSYILFARHFVRRLGEVGLALWGAVVIASAFGLLLWAPAWGWAVPAGFLAGLGYYMLHNTLQTNATQMAPQVRGTAVSLFASSFFLGQSLGVALAAVGMVRWGLSVPFVTAGCLMPVLGGLFAWLLARRHRLAAAATLTPT